MERGGERNERGEERGGERGERGGEREERGGERGGERNERGEERGVERGGERGVEREERGGERGGERNERGEERGVERGGERGVSILVFGSLRHHRNSHCERRINRRDRTMPFITNTTEARSSICAECHGERTTSRYCPVQDRYVTLTCGGCNGEGYEADETPAPPLTAEEEVRLAALMAKLDSQRVAAAVAEHADEIRARKEAA